MHFYVVFSVDVPQGEPLQPWTPRGKAWQQTESGETEYSYLEGEWEKGRHRKYVAELTRPQFDAFVDRMGLSAESTETGGILTGFGCLPAISFQNDSGDAIVNAYVCPLPNTPPSAFMQDEQRQQRTWDRVRQAVINTYT